MPRGRRAARASAHESLALLIPLAADLDRTASDPRVRCMGTAAPVLKAWGSILGRILGAPHAIKRSCHRSGTAPKLAGGGGGWSRSVLCGLRMVAVICGSMKRQVAMYNAADKRPFATLSSDFMTAIPSRKAVHPFLPIICAATNSGRLHVFK